MKKGLFAVYMVCLMVMMTLPKSTFAGGGGRT